MKLKNKGSSIINIGKTVLLPGESAEISGKGYQDNAVISFLMKKGILAESGDTEKSRSRRNGAARAKAAAEPDSPKPPEQE